MKENIEWSGVAKRCLNQVPLTEKRLLDSETSDSRPREEEGCCINEEGDHPSPESPRFISLCGQTSEVLLTLRGRVVEHIFYIN